MDDATSEIYSAFFVDEEGTQSSFRGRSSCLRIVIDHAVFGEIVSVGRAGITTVCASCRSRASVPPPAYRPRRPAKSA
jgi:hypothetical protein